MFNEIIFGVLVLLGIAGMVRTLKGPTIWDRMLGFNMVSSKITLSIILLAVITNRNYYLDIGLIYTLFGFISVVLIARFIQKRGEGQL